MGTTSEPAIDAMIRMAMAAESTGWAATGLLALVESSDMTGGWLIVSLSLGDSLSRRDGRHTRCVHVAPGIANHQCLMRPKKEIVSMSGKPASNAHKSCLADHAAISHLMRPLIS